MQIQSYNTPLINRLYREVNNHIRYYNLSIYKTLFGEYLLQKEYGSIKNKRPTGIRREYFLTLKEALKVCKKCLNEKMKKGYCYGK